MTLIFVIISLIMVFFSKPALAVDYFPTTENFLNNTISLSGSTGDLQIEDTNYRILRSFSSAYGADFQTTAVDVQTTLVSTTYTDKASLTWTVPSTGTYLVIANAGIGRSSTTAVRTSKAQMLIDGTSYAETFASDDSDLDLYRDFSGLKIQTLTAGSHTVKIQYAATNITTNKAMIKNARIVAMRVDNTQMHIPANGTTTAASYVDIATLTFIPKVSEDWLIMAHADITNSTSASYLNYANLMVGTTTLGETVAKVINISHFVPFDTHASVSLIGGTSYTFKIQMKRSAGTLAYKNVGLYAIPKSIFQASATVEAIGETSCTTCTSAAPFTVATLNLNTGVGGTYLITATGEQKNDSLTVYSGVRLNIGSTETQSILDVGVTTHWGSFSLQKIVSLDAGSTTASVQLFTQTSGTKVRIRNVRINAVKLGAASAQKMEVEFSGVGNTNPLSKVEYILNSAFSLASIGTTLQLYNYNSNAYPSSGDGFLSYISNSTANTFEEQNQTITTNPSYFKNSSTGAWKLKISSITSNGNWIDWSGDFLKYTTILQVSSTAPEIPTLLTPTNSSVSLLLTPTFKTTTTDINDDNLQYQLNICTNSSMTANCHTFDQSSNNIGWSDQDVGTSAYSSGKTATYTFQSDSSLTEGTTYYWKTKAKDPAGSNSWSSTQATPFSFTTNVRPNIPILISPGIGETFVSQTPTFKMVSTDIDGNPIQYKIELATNASFTGTTQTFDLSSSSTGWSSTDVDASTYSSGTTAVYIISTGSSLASSTIYYWRSYAKDPAGINSWSLTQSTPHSFTTITPRLDQFSFRWRNDDGGENQILETWLENFTYRKPMSVVNQIDSSLVDYQIGFTLDTATLIGNNKMQSDCDDLRITNNDKGTLLNYWIESGCNTSATKIWVKIPTLAASTGTTLYVYYGNISASAVSSGSNTFDFFDDFEYEGSLLSNGWSGFNINTSTDQSFSGSRSASLDNMTVTGQTTYRLVNKGASIFELKEYPTIITGSRYSFASATTDGSDRLTMGAYRNVANWRYWNGSWVSSSVPITYNQWNDIKWVANGNSNIKGYVNDTQIYNGNRTDEINRIGFEQYTYDGNDQAYIDTVRIRKFAATEPTISLDTETTQPPPISLGAAWLAAENVGITEVSLNSNIRLRFSIGNTVTSDSFNFRLQVAPKGNSSNCVNVGSSNFSDVPIVADSAVAVMTTSPNFINQEATTNQLTNPGATFIAGKMVEHNSNQSDNITLDPAEFTEVEYNFQMTSNAGSTTPYCFRVVNAGTTLNTYTNVAQLTTASFNNSPNLPSLPYVNNITAQTGQISPVHGLIDHTPAFSAIFDDQDTSNTASNYQIQIGTDSDWTAAEIWDSTKTAVSGTCNENSRCADVVYGGGTSLVDGSTYFWRIKFWDNFNKESPWSETEQFSMNSPPQVSSVIINNNNNINLSENSSIGISWSATITDTDGYTNLATATGKIYRSGIGSSCTPDNNNCYSDASCDFYDCSGSSCTAICSANLYFLTEATDTGSAYANQYYQALIQATDIYTEVGSTISTSTSIDVNSLSAFNIGSSLVYGEVFAGSNSGSNNTAITITNTGNSLINLEITGDYMCTDYPACGAQSIEPKYQQYKLNTFNYGTGTTLSTTPTVVNIGISKPTQTPSNSFKNLYWGIGIPNSQGVGNYKGATTILVY